MFKAETGTTMLTIKFFQLNSKGNITKRNLVFESRKSIKSTNTITNSHRDSLFKTKKKIDGNETNILMFESCRILFLKTVFLGWNI